MEEIEINDAWKKFAPGRVVLVVSKDKNGKEDIIPVSWCMRCSFTPQLVAISIGKTRYTHEILSSANEFVIAVPNKSLIEVLKFSGACSGRNTDKFKECSIKTEKAKKVDLSLIKDATLNFECVKKASHDSGTHTIFVGEIIAAHYSKKGILFNLKDGNFKELK